MSADEVFARLHSLQLITPEMGIHNGSSLQGCLDQSAGAQLISLLASAVNSLGPKMDLPSLAQHQHRAELFADVEKLIKHYGAEFLAESVDDVLYTMDFLSSELQCCCLLAEESPTTREDALISTLGQYVGSRCTEVRDAASLVKLITPDLVEASKSGGARLIVVGEDQVAPLGEIASRLSADYGNRAQVMIKRLDVLLRALLWGTTTSHARQGEIRVLIERQRLVLEKYARPDVSLVDVMCADVSLLKIRPITDRLPSRIPSVARAHVIEATVPDRGGRPNAGGVPVFKPRVSTGPSQAKKSKQKEEPPQKKRTLSEGGRKKGNGRNRRKK